MVQGNWTKCEYAQRRATHTHTHRPSPRFKFHISKDLSWALNTSSQLYLFFLRTLRKVHLSIQILMNFYCGAIKIILTNCISVWYGSCSVSNWKVLQWDISPGSDNFNQEFSSQMLPTEGEKHQQGHLSLQPWTVHCSHIWETLQKPPPSHQQAKEQLLPLSCQSAELFTMMLIPLLPN